MTIEHLLYSSTTIIQDRTVSCELCGVFDQVST